MKGDTEMISGKKYINNALFYTMFKKHYCPQCGKLLQRIKVSKIVNSKSPEAKNFDFSLGDSFMIGYVEFIWHEFRCPDCKINISIDRMRKIERGTRENKNEK